MRSLLVAALLMVGVGAQAGAQSCTGLCLQQTSCPAGQTTSVSGVVYAPNGVDPLPNILVYVPNAAVPAFAPGVSCPVVGAPPDGSPLVGTTTAVDGSFTIANMPVGANIPLVIQTGRWRRQVVIPTTTACGNTTFSTRFPQNQTEGDIPKIAISTGNVDQVECVLRKVGIADSEFTDPSGTGRINLYTATGGPGSKIDTATPTADTLMGNSATLNSYDVLMLPCEGGQHTEPAAQLANLITFANSGGRVYGSHYAYEWMFQNPPFSSVVKWDVQQGDPPDGVATVNTTFADGQTLAQWLQLTGASTTLGQMPISTLRKDFDSVNSPTQTYLTLNNSQYANPVQQFVFNTPIGATNQCGRVLFNEYHVESGTGGGLLFPNECSQAAITPQEKLLEYSLFELTAQGGTATLTPATQDFGSVPIGFVSAPQTFTWTNNSTFAATVTVLTATGDFTVGANACVGVAAGASCAITVVYNPTALGAETGVLTVSSAGSTLTAALTGTGTPGLSISPSSLSFPNVDVGASLTETLTLTNNASGAIPVPAFLMTGDFTASTSCTSVPAGKSCVLNVTFKPTATGPRTGTVGIYASGPTTALTGNGVDFSIALAPVSGQVVAGNGTATTATTTPIADFSAPVSLSCSTNAPASNCTLSAASFTLSAPIGTTVTITTTAKYAVIGYAGLGGGMLWLAGLGSGLLLWTMRRRLGILRVALATVLIGVAGLGMSGCSGKLPAQNAVYTPAGSYTYTVTATDGTITHTATYALVVTAQ